ncbi:MAG: ABC transporter ATP-binding protein [Oscillospiraceae bacterium]|nr:ABC transporter ATP-binding protein [Oscillospiraceae bacterium]
MNLVEIHGLSKRYGSIQALDKAELTLETGRIIGLAGPNGSGKTTLIKTLNGLICPDEGSVLIDGHEPDRYTRSILSYLPDRDYFADWMKISDMMDIFDDFYADFDRSKADELCRTLQLDPMQRIKSLSKGTREKMQLMLVMSRRSKLYVLDEPLAGVDPAAREFILHTILTNYNENGSVLISTHLISDVEQVLDEVVFIKEGQIVLHRNADDLRAETGRSIDECFREMFRYSGWKEN